MLYRIYADSTVLDEDLFDEADNHPYYDDYQLVEVPDEVVEYIQDSSMGPS